MLSTSKKMSVFDIVREAMDFRYPLSSPPVKHFSTRMEQPEGPFTSPIYDRKTSTTLSARVLHKTPVEVHRTGQTWLDHNILLPASSSPAQSPSDYSIASITSDHAVTESSHLDQATGNSSAFLQSLQLSDQMFEHTLSPDDSVSPKSQSTRRTDTDELFEGDVEEIDLSGLTELTESSLAAEYCSQFIQISTLPLAKGCSESSRSSRLPNKTKMRHPGDLFLVHSPPRVQVRDFAYELEMTSLATRRQNSPTESELALRSFEFHRALPEEEQVQRFHNQAFRKALRNVASDLSLKKQYYAWDQVRRKLDAEASNQDPPEQATSIDRRGSLYPAKLDVSVGFSTQNSWAQGDQAVQDHQYAISVEDELIRQHQPPEDVMEVDEPQSAAMEISPIGYSDTAIIQSIKPGLSLKASSFEHSDLSVAGVLLRGRGESHHEAVNEVDIFIQSGYRNHLPQHEELQPGAYLCGSPQARRGTVTAVSPDRSSTFERQLPKADPFDIHEDSSASTPTLPLCRNKEDISSTLSTPLSRSPPYQSKHSTVSYKAQLEDSSPIRQSVERETPRNKFVRESTPAYEDRSPSPSPISHISSEARTNLDLDTDIDMLDIPSIAYIPFEREDSMPPPLLSLARNSTHAIQREYNLPSSSPTTTPIISPTRSHFPRPGIRDSPIPISLPKTNTTTFTQHIQHQHPPCPPTLIPAPPPIPDSVPLKPMKRSARRESAVEARPSKVEKSRSVTLGTTGTTKEQQQLKQRSRSRKVTRAMERVLVRSRILDGGGGDDGGEIIEKVKEEGGIRRSKRLMGR